MDSWLPVGLIAGITTISLLALTYLFLYCRYRQDYLLVWAWAWICHATRNCVILGNVLLGGGYEGLLAVEQYLTLAVSILLLHGASRFAGRTFPRIMLGAVALDFVWIPVTVLAGVPRGVIYFPTYALLGGMQIVAGLALGRSPGEGQAARLTGLVLIVWGLHQFDYPLLRHVSWFAPWGFMIGAVLALSVAIGMIVLFFERLRGEQSATERRLKAILDTAMDGFVISDAQGRIVEANQACCHMLGYTRSELLGRHVAGFDATETEEERLRHMEKIVAEGHDRFITRLVRKDGGVVDAEISVQSLPDERGAMAAFLRDITESHRAEEAVRNESLRRAILMERSKDGIVIIDQGHRVVEANTRFAEMLGYGREEIVGVPTWEYEANLSEEEIRRDFGKLEEIKRVFETRHRRKDGTVFDVEVSLAGADVGGEQLVFAVCRDITQRREAEAVMRRAKEEAEAASRAKSAFLANMSHEIRTPLNGLLGMIQLIKFNAASPELKEYAAMAHSAGRRLTALLNDILDLARIEAGKMPIVPAPFAPRDLAASLAETFAPRHLGKDIDLEIVIAPDVPERLIGDVMRVRQVLFNLVGNAVKFTDSGGVRIEISRLLPPGPDRVRLLFLVSDTGIGIPEERLGDICAPFVQASDDLTKAHQGAGLGLSIAANLVQALGGSLHFDSVTGEGTTVALSLSFDLAVGAPA